MYRERERDSIQRIICTFWCKKLNVLIYHEFIMEENELIFLQNINDEAKR